ncbi:hypothetical protein Zmor_004879 [Zophobas morio]|uniref:Uncharacterized protein n=1 Tax=Zophobas morio TaxID=2755281 RepID=A0AA38IRA4_9CUCU|nr:hypothetical protein Zmor_004879 [Zophobas morio]
MHRAGDTFYFIKYIEAMKTILLDFRRQGVTFSTENETTKSLLKVEETIAGSAACTFRIDVNPIVLEQRPFIVLEIETAVLGLSIKNAQRFHRRAGIVRTSRRPNISRQNLSYNKKATYFIIVQFLAVGNQRIQCYSKPQSGATLI